MRGQIAQGKLCDYNGLWARAIRVVAIGLLCVYCELSMGYEHTR